MYVILFYFFVSDMPWVEGQLNLVVLLSIFASRTRREPKARRIYHFVSLQLSSICVRVAILVGAMMWLLRGFVLCCCITTSCRYDVGDFLVARDAGVGADVVVCGICDAVLISWSDVRLDVRVLIDCSMPDSGLF